MQFINFNSGYKKNPILTINYEQEILMFLVDKIMYAKETSQTVTSIDAFNYYSTDGVMLFDT